ncbi:MAG TPA: ABC transporter permease [Synergistaceae bacterium]|jgi:peptide/nickel transport system permease protein|nr:ABC transporter permease [Synergistaceae bacterium]NLL41430.1 ABC transporter permease [Synergistaceae bacterium]HPX03651.1 ABC transporter permease [Synergistaceae bacterium]HQA54488.1 ABC transporter permease [Synergistaceae bacterium]
MTYILRRKSVILLICIFFAGFIGPALMGGHPSDVVGAPFARPVWWNSQLPLSSEYSVGNDGAVIEWKKLPPEIFALNGKITADPGSRVRIIWSTTEGDMLLDTLEGSGIYWINMDGRDMIFKQKLGLPLIGKSTEHLFPSNGRYEIRIEGASETDLILSLPGGRQGLLGTDQRGRDILTLLIYGIRTSLTVGISATLIASLLGLGLGLATGYIGGWFDSAVMRAVDVLLSIPTLPIMMVLAGLWGKGLWQLVLILSIFSWMGTARSVRALVLTVRESPWVEGLRALGAGRGYILWRHLVPEAAPILLANVALGVPGAILAEAGLAFLGLSDPRLISWGRMLHEAHSFGAFTEGAWWLLVPPGLGIVALCLIFMDIGRYLEEKIDPRLGSAKNA